MGRAYEIDEDDSSLNEIMVSIIAEIMLVSATALAFFAYLRLPPSLATALSLFVLFIGSVICWKSFTYAQLVFFFSAMIAQLVLVNYFDWLLVGFLIFDMLAIFVFLKVTQPKNDEMPI
jgi:hypothetical protein